MVILPEIVTAPSRFGPKFSSKFRPQLNVILGNNILFTGGAMAYLWWFTPAGIAAKLGPGRAHSQGHGIILAIETCQPALKSTIYNECVRMGVPVTATPKNNRDALSANLSWHLNELKSTVDHPAYLACKRAGSPADRWRRSQSAAPDIFGALLRAAVEPISKDHLITIVIGGWPDAERALDDLVSTGRILQFRSGFMAARDDDR
jgi:hypothetical protein